MPNGKEKSWTMNPRPPCVCSFEEADRLLHQLESLTQAILQCSDGQNLPQLNQLILERGRLITVCTALDLRNLAPQQKEQLRVRVASCQALDVQIEQSMDHFLKRTDSQLKHIKQSQKLLSKYQGDKINLPDTRTQNA